MRQTLLTILLAALILATGWVWFRYVREPGAAEPELGAVEPERLAQYRQLKGLRPDTSVFSDPLFQSLERAGSAVPPSALPTGRANPFAPF